jgi:hypothetical protein
MTNTKHFRIEDNKDNKEDKPKRVPLFERLIDIEAIEDRTEKRIAHIKWIFAVFLKLTILSIVLPFILLFLVYFSFVEGFLAGVLNAVFMSGSMEQTVGVVVMLAIGAVIVFMLTKERL